MNKALHALVHYIKLNERGWLERTVQSWVETAFFYKQGFHFSTAHDVCEFIAAQFKRQFQSSEIQEAINSLTPSSLAKTPDGWKLIEKRIKEIQKQLDEADTLEQQVRDAWFEEVRQEHPQVGATQLRALWSQLIDEFIGPFFLRHGADTLRIIASLEAPPLQTHDDLLGLCSSKWDDALLEGIVRTEFPKFLCAGTPERREYLIRFADYSLAHYATGLDKSLLEQIYEKQPEFALFLDTNLLLSLRNLSENPLSEDARKAIEAARLVGNHVTVKLYLADVTQSEYTRIIDFTIQALSDYYWTREVSKAVLQCAQLPGLVAAYHKANAGRAVKPGDFFRPHRTAVPVFRNMGIDIFGEKFAELKLEQPVIDDVNQFKDYLDQQSLALHRRERQWETVEHDVVLWHAVRRKRPAADLFPDAKYFVLTCDRRFVAFDNYKQKQLGFRTPICLFPGPFLQIVRFFTPRSADFDAAFLHSLRIPIVTPFNAEREEVALKIVEAIAQFPDVTEKIACEILTDEALASQVRKAGEEQAQVLKIVQDFLAEKLSETRNEGERLKAELGEARTEKDRLQREASGKIEALERRVLELDQALSREKREREKERDVEERRRATEEQKRREQREQRMAYIKSLVTLPLALVAGVIAAYFLGSVLLRVSVQPRVGYAGLVLLALWVWYHVAKAWLSRVPFWQRWFKVVIGFVAFVAFVAAILQVMDSVGLL